MNLKIYLGGGGGGGGGGSEGVGLLRISSDGDGRMPGGQKSNPQKIPCQVSEPWKFPEIVKWYNTKNLQIVLTKKTPT